jgi:hypothetical protein
MSIALSPQRRPSTSSPTEAPLKKSERRQLTPKSLFHGLAHELQLLEPSYVRVHLAHPVLQPYPTLTALLDRLTKGPRDQAKNELLASLIVIQKRSPHRIWAAILLRAFRPMLRTLWKELFGTDAQERLALLLIGFQGAIDHLDPWRDPVRLGMYVRQATKRRAIAALTKEVRWNDVGFGEEADEVADVGGTDFPLPERLRAAHRLLRSGELAAHVRRAHPRLTPEQQAALHRRLRRRLERVFLEVRPTDGVRGKEVAL